MVFGFLNPDKTIDQERTKEFIELIHYYGASATLHKVIDITVDKHEALQTLHRLGIDRILTSPANYIPLKSDFRDIEIVAGGGIGEQNIASLLSRQMKSLHFFGRRKQLRMTLAVTISYPFQNFIVLLVKQTKDKQLLILNFCTNGQILHRLLIQHEFQ